MLQELNAFFTVFQVIDKPERAVFEKFVTYRCTKKKAEPLLKLITYLSSQNGAVKIEKELLLKLQRETASNTDAQLRGVITNLKILLDDFLAHQQLDQQALEKSQLLANAFAERNLYKAFAKQVKNVTLDLEQKIALGKNLEPMDFLVISRLNEKLFFHPNTYKTKSKVIELDKSLETLDKSYVLKKMRLLSDLSIRQNFLSKQATIQLDYLLTLANSFPEPIFKLYAQLLSLLQNHDELLFQKLLSDFKTQIAFLSPFDKGIFFEKLINHANKIYETGKIDYLNHLLDLMQMSDQHGMIAQHNKIDPLVFINAVSVGCFAKAFDWVNHFMQKYTPLLSIEDQDDTLKMAHAYYHFFEEEYEASLQNIKKSKSLGILLSGKTLFLRIYYEKIFKYRTAEAYDLFLKKAEALNRWLQKDREKDLSDNKKQAIKNFIITLKEFIEYLYLNNPQERPEKLIKITEDLDIISPIIAKAWLFVKLEQLKNIKRLNQLP